MKSKLYVARSPLASARRLGNEILVMSTANSTLFTLNEVASLIWEAADGVTPVDQIVTDKICGSFDVEPDAALLDAEAVVKKLAAHGVLSVSDRPIPGASKLPANSAARPGGFRERS
jgi:Coenzyme PQQ synthesis protein D (PqqD)